MDIMKNPMQALRQGMVASARARQAALAGSKVQTAGLLRAFDRERSGMAKDLKSGLAADRAGRSLEVRAIRAHTGTLRQEFRQAQVRLRRSLRRRLVDSTETLATRVASLRADFAKRRADFAKAHRHMARAQRTGLAKDRRDRSRDVAELINNFHLSRGEMAQELAENLAKSTQQVRSHVSGLNEWRRAALQKNREDASGSRPILSYLLTAQGGEAARGPSSTLAREPEERKKKRRVKTKTTSAKAVKASVRKPAKPKKKATVAKVVRAFVGKPGKPKRK